MIRTFGRMPALGEVKEYYARDDVLGYICDAAVVRDVVLSFKMEPSIRSEAETPPLRRMGSGELREYLTQQFTEAFPESSYPAERPLNAYPSFHFLTKGGDREPWDFIMEADCSGWRRSFVDVRGAVELLQSYQVPFMMKFSGHRSLHLIIPREAFPEEFRDRPTRQIWEELEKDLRKFLSRHALVRQAHGTGGMLRLPYSLNEDTGMVSLPIRYAGLSAFRPWQAFHHLVEVEDDLKLSHFIQKCREESGRMADFLAAALDHGAIPRLSGRIWSFSLAKKSQYVRNGPEVSIGKAHAAWRNLVTGSEIDDMTLRTYRSEENPDVRWFIAESLIGDERSFDLLPESDEYALCAIEDSIAYLGSNCMDAFVEGVLRLNHHQSLRALRSTLERLDLEALRKELLIRVEMAEKQELRRIIRCAYTIGSAFSDWAVSEEVMQRTRERSPDALDEAEIKVFRAIKNLEAQGTPLREVKRILVAVGKQAVDQVDLAMTYGNQRLRKKVMDIVLELNDPAFIGCLVNALADDMGKLRSRAMSALIDFGNAARKSLEEAADADDLLLRANAIRTLSMIEGRGSLDIGIRALKNANTMVKSAGVQLLSRMDDERAREALKSALWDVDPDIAIKAAFALAATGKAGQSILQHALAQAEAQRETQAARCIAHGLAKLGEHSVVDHLICAIHDESWCEPSTARLIAQLEHPDGDDALLRLARSYLLKRHLSFDIMALGNMADGRVTPLMVEFLPDQRDKKMLQAGVDLLTVRAIRLKEQAAIQALIDLAQEDNQSLAQRAANAIVKIGSEAVSAVVGARAKDRVSTTSQRYTSKR